PGSSTRRVRDHRRAAPSALLWQHRRQVLGLLCLVGCYNSLIDVALASLLSPSPAVRPAELFFKHVTVAPWSSRAASSFCSRTSCALLRSARRRNSLCEISSLAAAACQISTSGLGRRNERSAKGFCSFIVSYKSPIKSK